MDSFKLAKSVIQSEHKEGIEEFTRVKSSDTPEITFMKLWLKYWFIQENNEIIEQLAISTLGYLIQKENNV